MRDKMILGERFAITFKVRSTAGEDFAIDSASYDVEIDGEVSTGIGEINNEDHTISAFFSPTKTGIYTITLSYTIGNEVRMARFVREVTE